MIAATLNDDGQDMTTFTRLGPFNVEDIFNKFTKDIGGNLVSDLIPKSNKKPNADYVFKDSNVIAELKCFQKDLFSDEDDAERVDLLLKKWTKEGFFSKESEVKQMLIKRQLPEPCAKDLMQAARKTIDGVIHHADKQLRETKKLLNMPDARGLLLLCNDGNYFLQHMQFMSLITDVLLNKYMKSDIDGFIYFTVNQASYSKDIGRDNHLWFPMYREDGDKILSPFVNQMGYQFMNDYFPKLTGVSSNIIDSTDNLTEGLKKIIDLKYVPKNIIYKKKGGC